MFGCEVLPLCVCAAISNALSSNAFSCQIEQIERVTNSTKAVRLKAQTTSSSSRPARQRDKLERINEILDLVSKADDLEGVQGRLEEGIREFSVFGEGHWGVAALKCLSDEAKRIATLPDHDRELLRHSCSLQRLGRSLFLLDRHKEAEPLLADSLYIHRQVLGEQSLLASNVTAQCAMCMTCEGAGAEKAVRLAENALDSVAEALGKDSPICAIYLCGLGQTLVAMGDLERAPSVFAHARSILEKAGEVRNSEYASALYGLGCIARRQGRQDLSENLLIGAINVVNDNDVDNPKLIAFCMYEIALLLEDRHDFCRAEQWMGGAGGFIERAVQPYDSNLAKFFEDYARIALKADEGADVEPFRTRAREIRLFRERMNSR